MSDFLLPEAPGAEDPFFDTGGGDEAQDKEQVAAPF
jgi:hypothetical protein